MTGPGAVISSRVLCVDQRTGSLRVRWGAFNKQEAGQADAFCSDERARAKKSKLAPARPSEIMTASWPSQASKHAACMQSTTRTIQSIRSARRDAHTTQTSGSPRSMERAIERNSRRRRPPAWTLTRPFCWWLLLPSWCSAGSEPGARTGGRNKVSSGFCTPPRDSASRGRCPVLALPLASSPFIWATPLRAKIFVFHAKARGSRPEGCWWLPLCQLLLRPLQRSWLR
jgi:hypothetical protein